VRLVLDALAGEFHERVLERRALLEQLVNRDLVRGAAPPLPAYGAPMAPVDPAYAMPPAPVGPPPRQVSAAATLLLVNAALGVVGIIVLFASKHALRASIVKKNPSFDSTKVNTAVNAALVFGTVVAVILIALYVWLSRQLLKAKQWARVTTWVLSGLAVLFTLLSLASPQAAGPRASNLVGAALAAAIIILLAQRPSNEFFRARR
jgi:hypothetical protein